MAQPTYAGLARVEFEYEAQTEDELTVQEDQVVWVLEDDDHECVAVRRLAGSFEGAGHLRQWPIWRLAR